MRVVRGTKKRRSKPCGSSPTSYVRANANGLLDSRSSVTTRRSLKISIYHEPMQLHETEEEACSLYCFHWRTTGFSGKPFNFYSPVDTIPPPSTLTKEAYTRWSGREDFAFPRTVNCLRKTDTVCDVQHALLHALRSIVYSHYERLTIIRVYTYVRLFHGHSCFSHLHSRVTRQ